MILKITNNLTKNSLSYNVKDNYTSNVFFHFYLKLGANIERVALEDIEEGEYTYNLYDADKKIAEGLLQIGEYKVNNKEYNNEKKYKVYGK